MKKLTSSQRKALDWLHDRGGDAAWCKGTSAVLAQGEIAPFDRVTWERLEAAGMIESYGGTRHGGKGYGRLRVK